MNLFLTFIVNSVYMKVKVKQSLYWPGLALTVPRFTDSRHMKLVRLSTLIHRLSLPPWRYLWCLFLLKAVSTPEP